MKTNIRAGILGITGYAGIELFRLLLGHPHVEITYGGTSSNAGKPIADLYPHLKGTTDLVCREIDIDAIASACDVVFAALPHGASCKVIPALYEKGLRIIDLSGDFRYEDPAVYKQWYDIDHPAPDLLDISVYGLPELHRAEIAKTTLIGNPGCYTTCSILGLYPLLKMGLCDTKNIIIDAKSGVTGAGRSLSQQVHFCECAETFKAYKIATHRHTSEIEQELSMAAGQDIMLSFTPHLIPAKRGILATCYANLNGNTTQEELVDIYKEFYKDEYFVRVYDAGELPQTGRVAGSNFVDIGIEIDKRLNRAIIVSAIDNLYKGASGQAVQNMNILFGLDEKTGIDSPGYYL